MSQFRIIFFAALLAVLPTASATAVTLGALELGGQQLDIAISITDPRGAVASNGFVHVVGNHGGVGVRQIIDLANGTITGIEAFTSQHVAQNGGVGGNDGTFLSGVSQLTSGQVVYHGFSATALWPNNPTYWFDPSNPVAASSDASDAGTVRAISPSGVTDGT